MASVKTGKLIGKLKKVVDFRIGQGASERCQIVLHDNANMPFATDGTQIFLPRQEIHFSSERDNKIWVADCTAHESDHIREFEQYFGEETGKLREQKTNFVEEYLQRNFSELEENPALASWIDNIVADRRIDAERREQLPGSKRFNEEVFLPTAEYLRPSIIGMSELDAFREQYLQRALLGKTIEPVREHSNLLEEIVDITNSADSIQKDKDVVTKIYQVFKENFDIKQPISKLPPLFGRDDPSQSSRGSGKNKGEPQQGYGKEVKPREGRNPNDKRPKKLSKEGDGNEKDYKSDNKNGKGDKEEKVGQKDNQDSSDKKEKDSNTFYPTVAEKEGMQIYVPQPQLEGRNPQRYESLKNKYAGEIESMKRIFRQLQLKFYGERRDFEGQELNYEDYMQAELEARVTKIHGNEKYFKREDIPNKQRPVIGIHADASSSTQGRVIEGIRDAFFIIGNALSASDWNYGLYTSREILTVIKDPTKKWTDEVNYNIMDIGSGGCGIFLHQTSSIISRDLRRINGNPKFLIVLSDFEVRGESAVERKVAKTLLEQKVYPFYIAIGQEHKAYARDMASEIGEEHHSVVGLNKLHELPNEMFRLFKTFGIAR